MKMAQEELPKWAEETQNRNNVCPFEPIIPLSKTRPTITVF